MLKKDDEDWLALLDGKEVPDADPNTVHEVRALKEVLDTELQWQKLQIRIQAEQAKENKRHSVFEWLKMKMTEMTDFNQTRTGYRFALAAVILVVVVGPLLFLLSPINNQQYARPKGSATNQQTDGLPITRYASNPKQKAEKIKEQFEQAGAEVKITELNDTSFQVEISMPKTLSPELGQLCDIEGICDNTVIYQKPPE